MLTVGDIDRDGKADLAGANYFSNTVSILRNISQPGLLSFAAKTEFVTNQAPRLNYLQELPDLKSYNF